MQNTKIQMVIPKGHGVQITQQLVCLAANVEHNMHALVIAKIYTS